MCHVQYKVGRIALGMTTTQPQDYYYYDQNQFRSAEKIVVHWGFVRGSIGNNIALIKFKKWNPFHSKFMPICLPGPGNDVLVDKDKQGCTYFCRTPISPT